MNTCDGGLILHVSDTLSQGVPKTKTVTATKAVTCATLVILRSA